MDITALSFELRTLHALIAHNIGAAPALAEKSSAQQRTTQAVPKSGSGSPAQATGPASRPASPSPPALPFSKLPPIGADAPSRPTTGPTLAGLRPPSTPSGDPSPRGIVRTEPEGGFPTEPEAAPPTGPLATSRVPPRSGHPFDFDQRMQAFRSYALAASPGAADEPDFAPASSPEKAVLRNPESRSASLAPSPAAPSPDARNDPETTRSEAGSAMSGPARARPSDGSATAAQGAPTGPPSMPGDPVEQGSLPPAPPGLGPGPGGATIGQGSGWTPGVLDGLALGALAELSTAAGQVERGGIIASFILNAAMIPGWPPPRPIEPAGIAGATFADRLARAGASEEEQLMLLLLRMQMNDPERVRRLFEALAPAWRRSKLIALLAVLVTGIKTVIEELVQELEAMAQDRAEDALAAKGRRVVLR